MQLVINLQNPKPLKISFVYTRTVSIDDNLDECIYDFTKRLSDSFSAEPYSINRFSNVNSTKLISSNYNLTENVNLIFRCFKKNGTNYSVDKEQTFALTLYFDTADKIYVKNLITNDYFIRLEQQDFTLLNTLTTY